MRRGGRIMMMFGLVLGVITAVVTLILLNSTPTGPTEGGSVLPDGPGQPVVVALQPLEPYQPIPADALGLQEWPGNLSLPPGAFTDTSAITDVLPAVKLYPGQVLVQDMIIIKSREEQRLGLGSDPSYIVPSGQVAVTLPLDEVAMVAGTVRDGDRVDILASFQLDKYSTIQGSPELVSQILVENVVVLKVGTWNFGTDSEENNRGSGLGMVTVIVEPQEALVLKKAKDDAYRIDLALRAANDTTEHTGEPVGDATIVEEYRFRTQPMQPLP